MWFHVTGNVYTCKSMYRTTIVTVLIPLYTGVTLFIVLCYASAWVNYVLQDLLEAQVTMKVE